MRKSHFFSSTFKNKQMTRYIGYTIFVLLCTTAQQQQQAASNSILLTFSLSFVTVWNQILPMAEINLCESAKCVSICLEFMLTYRNANRSFDLSDAKCDRIECTSRWLLITCFCFCCHSLAPSLFRYVHYVFIVCICFLCCADTYLLHLLINKSRGHLLRNLFVCVYMHSLCINIWNKSYDFGKSCWNFFRGYTLGVYLFHILLKCGYLFCKWWQEKRKRLNWKKWERRDTYTHKRNSIGNWQANKRLNPLTGSRFRKVKEISIQKAAVGAQ